MKRQFRYWIGCLCWLACCWTSCSEAGLEEGTDWETDRITLLVSTGSTVSRTIDDTTIESALDHLDVFISEIGAGDEPDEIVHYERIEGPLASPTGTARLNAKKKQFTQGVSYRVDVIANAKATESEFSAFDRWTDLQSAVQEDYRIQITGGYELGAVDANTKDVPSRFLMDGIAFAADQSEKSVVLNDGTSMDTQLQVVLRRAAAKIVVKLSSGSSDIIRFDGSLEAQKNMGYNLRNLPYSTAILAESPHVPMKRKTDFFAGSSKAFFNWTENMLTITTYVYSHDWSGDGSSFFEDGTRMTVNLPVLFKEAGQSDFTSHPNSFYQILLSKENKFERNTYYEVNATINAPGATSISNPDTLKNLKYSAAEWTDVAINVGSEHRPTFLSVNKDTLDMYNIIQDGHSLSFVSSSDVTVSVEEIWYYNKFGQKVGKDSTMTDVKYLDRTDNVVKTLKMPAFCSGNIIQATPDIGLSGNIDMYSPLPMNNTVRYIKLKVTNEDESTPEYVLVRQYPLEYITNTQGWYSYRSDYGRTTFEDYGDAGIIGLHKTNFNYLSLFDAANWIDPLFGSKVATPLNDGSGKSDIRWYFWWKETGYYNWWGQWISTGSERVYEPYQVDGSLTGLKNARMYHVRITSSSSKYNVGIPKQTVTEEKLIINGKEQVHYNNKTATDALNNTLVSPSFMIASQLGATQSPDSRDVAATHCSQYVEVYRAADGSVVHLTNWRLPTQKEIQIITSFQVVPNAAMDVVLSGANYWSAAGIVDKSTGELSTTATSGAIRCVRDAYY